MYDTCGSMDEQEIMTDTSDDEYGDAAATKETSDASKDVNEEDELEMENELIEGAIKNIPDDIESALKMYSIIFTTSHPYFQDILPMVLDGREFVIDGDGLLMMVLSSSSYKDRDCGGQTLHIVYIIERFLSTLVIKGLKFIFVFLKTFKDVWPNLSPPMALARECVRIHLKNNSPFEVCEFESIWHPTFQTFINQTRPGFYMTFVGMPNFKSMEIDNELQLRFLIYSQLACCSLYNLDIVDIDTIKPAVSSIFARVHVSSRVFPSYKLIIDTMNPSFEKTAFKTNSQIFSNNVSIDSDARMSLVIKAAMNFLKSKEYQKTTSELKVEVLKTIQIVILHAVLLNYLPLSFRCFKKLPEIPKQYIAILHQFQQHIVLVLRTSIEEKTLGNLVADIWHGNLIKVLFYTVSHFGGLHKAMLGNEIADQFDKFTQHLHIDVRNDEYDIFIKPCLDGNIEYLLCEDKSTEKFFQKVLPKLIPSSCKITNLFCEDIVADDKTISELNPQLDSYLNVIESWKLRFQEVTHWHVKKPLTDEYDRIPENKDTNDKNSKHSQTQKNRMSRFNTYYGQSLEGRINPVTIITKQSNAKTLKNESKNKKKTSKPSGKKEKIIEENLKRKSTIEKKVGEDKLKSILNNYNSLISKGHFLEASMLCDTEQSAKISECDVFLLLNKKIEALYKYLCNIDSDEIMSMKNKGNFAIYKESFITVQKILTMSQVCSSLFIEKYKQLLSKFLYSLGFNELAQSWDLPLIQITENKLNVKMSHIEFQMKYLSSDLDRDVKSKPDDRVQGFNPDPWQKKLFDIIDENQSAVVVAPTSSGKTYACYYCMEKVIKESDDGIVIYVCPSKALVNQVYATIYARFKKTLPPGKVLQGVFTRDYKTSVVNCQILVTVPECLEILLLSPRRNSWAKNLKYVIFDEVHCLVGQAGGIAWENSLLLIQCPYLALSATINEPELFRSWLQEAEDFKRDQQCGTRPAESYKVHLIVHNERYNHLKKSILHLDGSDDPLHPYAVLDHNSSIPQHISLAPHEALQLYDAIKDHVPAVLSNEINPNNYFTSAAIKGFITMPMVKKYSEKLRNIMENLPKKSFEAILKCLKPFPKDSYEGGDANVLHYSPVILEFLKRKKMFPALIFSYNRGLVNNIPLKLLTYLEEQGSSESEEEEPEVKMKETNLEKKNPKQEKRAINYKPKYKRELNLMGGPSILKSNGSIRGEGYTDEKIIEFLESRLKRKGFTSKSEFVLMLRKGLGKHYGGMNNVERSTVEILFRMKVLNMVFATGTLAQGIHMPCKTVVVAGDSPYLNSLEFHQMSGRAGRRGFDKEGNVIFFGLNERKIKTLMTANVPKMIGNFPMSLTLVLRILLLVSDVTDLGVASDDTTKATVSRCLTLLEKSLLYETCPNLKEQIKHYFLFAHQFLIYQGLINDGKPLLLSGLVTHLHHHDPAIFAFVYLLRNQHLEKLCVLDKNGDISCDSLNNLMIVLNFLFAPLPYKKPIKEVKWHNSMVILPELPDSIEKALEDYNTEVYDIFSHYYGCVSSYITKKQGLDNVLPLSKTQYPPPTSTVSFDETSSEFFLLLKKLCVSNNVCSAFAGLSGNTDADLFPTKGSINNVRHDIDYFVKIIPTIILNQQYNSYALDFFKHGISKAIIKDNGLRSGEDFRLLTDFNLALLTISLCLDELLPKENKLRIAVETIKDIFETKYRESYYERRLQ